MKRLLCRLQCVVLGHDWNPYCGPVEFGRGYWCGRVCWRCCKSEEVTDG